MSHLCRLHFPIFLCSVKPPSAPSSVAASQEVSKNTALHQFREPPPAPSIKGRSQVFFCVFFGAEWTHRFTGFKIPCLKHKRFFNIAIPLATVRINLILNQFDCCHLLGQLVVVRGCSSSPRRGSSAPAACSGCPGVVLHACSGGDHGCNRFWKNAVSWGSTTKKISGEWNMPRIYKRECGLRLCQ
jgi:hypothetical protein